MSVEIRLNNDFSNPFYTDGFHIDFQSSSPSIDPDGAGTYLNYDGTVLTIESGVYTIEVTFDPAVTAEQIDGVSLGSLITPTSIIRGSEAPDVLSMTDFPEAIYGGSGNDWLDGRGGGDFIFGDDGNDVIYGGAGDDHLFGATEDEWSYDPGADILYGGTGADILDGNYGRDTLYGGAGTDALRGGRGGDILFGGPDADRFIFDTRTKKGFDTIGDFDRKEGDRLLLDLGTFPELKKTGLLKKKYFDAGDKHADDKNDFLVYHKKKGALYFDKDGSGGKKAVLLADFDKGTKLKAADIDII